MRRQFQQLQNDVQRAEIVLDKITSGDSNPKEWALLHQKLSQSAILTSGTGQPTIGTDVITDMHSLRDRYEYLLLSIVLQSQSQSRSSGTSNASASRYDVDQDASAFVTPSSMMSSVSSVHHPFAVQSYDNTNTTLDRHKPSWLSSMQESSKGSDYRDSASVVKLPVLVKPAYENQQASSIRQDLLYSIVNLLQDKNTLETAYQRASRTIVSLQGQKQKPPSTPRSTSVAGQSRADISRSRKHSTHTSNSVNSGVSSGASNVPNNVVNSGVSNSMSSASGVNRDVDVNVVDGSVDTYVDFNADIDVDNNASNSNHLIILNVALNKKISEITLKHKKEMQALKERLSTNTNSVFLTTNSYSNSGSSSDGGTTSDVMAQQVIQLTREKDVLQEQYNALLSTNSNSGNGSNSSDSPFLLQQLMREKNVLQEQYNEMQERYSMDAVNDRMAQVTSDYEKKIGTLKQEVRETNARLQVVNTNNIRLQKKMEDGNVDDNDIYKIDYEDKISVLNGEIKEKNASLVRLNSEKDELQQRIDCMKEAENKPTFQDDETQMLQAAFDEQHDQNQQQQIEIRDLKSQVQNYITLLEEEQTKSRNIFKQFAIERNGQHNVEHNPQHNGQVEIENPNNDGSDNDNTIIIDLTKKNKNLQTQLDLTKELCVSLDQMLKTAQKSLHTERVQNERKWRERTENAPNGETIKYNARIESVYDNEAERFHREIHKDNDDDDVKMARLLMTEHLDVPRQAHTEIKSYNESQFQAHHGIKFFSEDDLVSTDLTPEKDHLKPYSGGKNSKRPSRQTQNI